MEFSRAGAIDFVSGWTAGAASVAVSQPLDTVLVRLQNAPPRVSRASVVSELWKEGGIRAFWRGSWPMIWMVPLQNGLLFAGYGIGARLGEDGELSSVFFGGCAGGLAQSFVASPFELAKIRLQVTPSTATVVGPGVGAWQGIGGRMTAALTPVPWRGLEATCWRDVMPHGVWFASYEWSKARSEAAGLGAVSSALLSGAFAAAVAWVVGYPFDVIKTRIQAKEEPVSVAVAAKEMLAEAGGDWRQAYYRGLGLKLGRAVPCSALTFGVYEAVSSMLFGLV